MGYMARMTGNKGYEALLVVIDKEMEVFAQDVVVRLLALQSL